jgi:hypothetical protein
MSGLALTLFTPADKAFRQTLDEALLGQQQQQQQQDVTAAAAGGGGRGVDVDSESDSGSESEGDGEPGSSKKHKAGQQQQVGGSRAYAHKVPWACTAASAEAAYIWLDVIGAQCYC